MPEALSFTQAETAYSARLKELSADEWQALRIALQRVEAADSVGAWTQPVQLEDGSWQMAYAQLSSEANDFMRTLDDLGLHIPFDWPSWDQGRNLAENREGLTGATRAEAAMVILAIWRPDRFVEGELLKSFETGIIQGATRRLLQAGHAG